MPVQVGVSKISRDKNREETVTEYACKSAEEATKDSGEDLVDDVDVTGESVQDLSVSTLNQL